MSLSVLSLLQGNGHCANALNRVLASQRRLIALPMLESSLAGIETTQHRSFETVLATQVSRVASMPRV